MTANQNRTPATNALPARTRVLNTTDGEAGTVLNGYARDAGGGGWTEYEVETASAIEIWKAADLIVLGPDGRWIGDRD